MKNKDLITHLKRSDPEGEIAGIIFDERDIKSHCEIWRGFKITDEAAKEVLRKMELIIGVGDGGADEEWDIVDSILENIEMQEVRDTPQKELPLLVGREFHFPASQELFTARLKEKGI